MAWVGSLTSFLRLIIDTMNSPIYKTNTGKAKRSAIYASDMHCGFYAKLCVNQMLWKVFS